MNRNQRRKAEKERKHREKQQKRLTPEQAEAVREVIKEQRMDALGNGVYTFETVAKLVLYKLFGFKKKRLNRWYEEMKFQLECISSGHITVDDIEQLLDEEVYNRKRRKKKEEETP